VGYRNFVEHTAGKIKVSGYVRNRQDGSVEVLGIGTPEQLHLLRRALEKGPMMAQVKQVDEEPSEVEPKYLRIFTIEFTE
jgi:acylphosphatase